MKKAVLLVLMVILMQGCMAMLFQRLSMEDMRSVKYFYKSYRINKSIAEINQIFYDRRIFPRLRVNPSGHGAYVAWERWFASGDPKVIGLIDFKESGSYTEASAYWYYYTDRVLSDRIIASLSE